MIQYGKTDCTRLQTFFTSCKELKILCIFAFAYQTWSNYNFFPRYEQFQLLITKNSQNELGQDEEGNFCGTSERKLFKES